MTRRPIGACLLLSLFASVQPAAAESFNWTPAMLYASGSIADEVSTRRFLSNGSGCGEAARWIGGAKPATWKLTATTVGATAVVTLMHYAIYKAGKQTGHPTLAKVLN